MRLANLGPTCQMQRAQGYMDTLNSQAANVSDCYSTTLCNKTNEQATMSAMQAAVNRLGANPVNSMGNPGAFVSLQTGASTFCNNPYAGTNITQQEIMQNRAYGGGIGSTEARCRAFHSSLISADKNLGSVGGPGMYNPTSGRAW